MPCTCPKCNSQIEIDVSHIPEKGTFLPCSDCKGRFWINKESYARMALKKEGKTYCDKCNNELTHSIVCTDCGIMYPDFYLVQVSKPPRRKADKPGFLSMSFTLRPAKQSYKYTYTASKASHEKSSNLQLKKIGLVVVIALLAVGLCYLYYTRKSEQQYARNYMRALFTIKSGTELNFTTCEKLSNEWQASMNVGQKFSPHINAEDESHLNNVKETVDGFMKMLNKPPKKFIISSEKLATLYGVYTKVHTLATAPPGSLSTFNNLASKSKSEFRAATQELKNSMPAELSSELKLAQAKYKGLRDM